MGRIRSEIGIDGRRCWTLFDSGARHSCISRAAVEGLDVESLRQPRRAMLGGGSHDITEACLVQADIDGHPVEFQASVIDEIGVDEEGRTIDVLFGALAMQMWGIRLDPPQEKLDPTHYTRDFVEF